MKLRGKALLATLLTWLVIVTGLIIGSYTIILSDYRRMEQGDISYFYNRNQQVIERLKDTLDLLLLDWSHWDVAYQFIQTKDPAFIKTYLTNVRTYQDIKVNLIMFFDAHNQFISGYQYKQNQLLPISEVILSYIKNHPILLQHIDINKSTIGFVKIANDYILMGAYPVTNSAATAPPNGTLIMGYFFDYKRIQQLAKTLQVSMNLIPLNQVLNIPNLDRIVRALQNESYYAIPRNNHILDFYTFLYDINDKPIAIIHASMPRSTYQEGLRTIVKYISAISLVGIAILFLVAFLLKYFILDRILSFKRQLTEIIATQDFSKQISVRGHDEITDMVESSNSLLNVISQNEKKMTELIGIQYKDLLIRKENETKLSDLNQKMSSTLKELKIKEKTLSDTNTRLANMMEAIKQHEHELILVNRMNEMLQFCQDSDELYSVINLAAKELFPHVLCEFAIYNKSMKQLELARGEGHRHLLKEVFNSEDCWGLRAGRSYVYEPQNNLLCEHFTSNPSGGYICIPLIIANEFIGLLVLIAPSETLITKNQQQLAITFSDVIKLSLAAITLRKKQ